MNRYVKAVEEITYELSADEVKTALREMVRETPCDPLGRTGVVADDSPVSIRADGSALITVRYEKF